MNRRWAALLILLLYLMQMGASSWALAPTSHDAEADVCCDVCSKGGPCCCLAAAGVTSCDVIVLGGPVIRPAPCGGMGAAAVLPAVATAVDHMLPLPEGLRLPSSQQVPIHAFSSCAHSLRLGPPDKIPIV
ncbi:MAG: hypothetical protein HN712_10970 [Gemmatimonadetes bacterium]|jgi:hypothetical protein|nr:hypothetical protein [Gemmatimonadota bacterium]MBT6149946.1 hypothetical protein [Gemmatimonadota bacterium]MBT7860827.1 hypothetical protein [Gemmatimonadota bacterium]